MAFTVYVIYNWCTPWDRCGGVFSSEFKFQKLSTFSKVVRTMVSRSPVRIPLCTDAMRKSRGFRYVALFTLVGVGLYTVHRIVQRRRKLKHEEVLRRDEEDLHNDVEALIDEQVCNWFPVASDGEKVTAEFDMAELFQDAEALKAVWNVNK